MSWTIVIILGALAVAIFMIFGTYNGLVAGQQEVRNSWSQIDIQLKRRHDLIPNLVNTVKGAMDIEKSTLAAVMEARGRAVSATTPGAAMQAENALTGALRGLFAVVESYPQLRSQQNVSGLMEELSGTENKIAFARQHYNDAVAAQNVRIAAFPGVVLARSFGFTTERMFEVPEAEKGAINAVPDVKF